jgi:hypothetical protein
MCIVIDINTFASVFDSNSQNHAEFKPVLEYVTTKQGRMVYGGTRYIDEIPHKFLSLVAELTSAGRAIMVDGAKVDEEGRRLSKLVQHPDFDDQHLVALLIVSNVKLICSLDKRAYPFFRSKEFFGTGSSKRPRIYQGAKNKDLLEKSSYLKACNPGLATMVGKRNPK